MQVGDRVRVKEGVTSGILGNVNCVGDHAIRAKMGDWNVRAWMPHMLEALPPEDSEKRDKEEDVLEQLPFSELSLLDVLIASLDNESLGRVVRALREAGLL